jgi:methylenetetrahydrofolate dehydrogenase (NADP+) / methenyltetrahydrofolate cyclohydrolase
MIILDGKKIKAKYSSILKEEIGSFLNKGFLAPKLAIIQIGNNESSNVYINQKIKFANEIGAEAELIKLEENISENYLLEKIAELNNDKTVNGIILQLPIPVNFNQGKILEKISPEKDVDGLCPVNIYKLIRNDSGGLIPATAKGIISLLKEYEIEISGKNIVVVGKSVLVGKTLSLALLNLGATVTICHSKTNNLSDITKKADILISAVGKAGLITDEYLKEDQVVIDVGISKNSEGNISGDVFLEKAIIKTISPVPGGVGQMTVVSLFQNLVETYKKQISL